MKTILFLLLLSFKLSFSQDCGLENVLLPSQSDVDNFIINHPNCTKILGDLKIGGTTITHSDITDITGLANITEIQGTLTIEYNEVLANLNGLQNLESVGQSLILGFNNSLSDISSLSKIRTLPSELVLFSNPFLTNLTGLEQLSSVESLNILFSPLVNLDQLANLQSINNLIILENISLNSCSIQSICSHLNNEEATPNIRNNGPNCSSKEKILNSCKTLSSEIFNKEIKTIKVYPNPTNGILKISGNKSTIKRIVLNNLTGAFISEERLSEKNSIDISLLKNGIYFITIQTNDGLNSVQKIIKN